MNPTATRRLIRRMLDSRTLLPETVEELKDYLKELERGTLDPSDDAYVHQLAQRLGFDRSKSKTAATEPDEDEQPEEKPEEEQLDASEEDEEEEEEVYEPDDIDAAPTAAVPDARVEEILAALARARAALDTLHDPGTGINLELGPDQAAELLAEIRRALDDAEDRLGEAE